jgi:hypothetical protein
MEVTRVENSTTEKTVVFLHIPKTAGTTLHRIIERHYRPEQLYSVGFREDESVDALAKLSEKRRAQIRLLRGHFGFGVHKYLPGPSTYMTILRDPVDRLISYYYFIRRTPSHHLYNYVTSGDLYSFVECRRHIMTDNAQTRFLSGVWFGPFYGDRVGEVTPEMLETAKANLREHFAVVGVADRFDETLILAKRAFGWRNLFYARQNVTASRPSKDELPAATLDIIVEANQLDIELYRCAKELCEKQVWQNGLSFACEAASFRLLNRPVSLLIAAYVQIRKVSVRVLLRNWINRLFS